MAGTWTGTFYEGPGGAFELPFRDTRADGTGYSWTWIVDLLDDDTGTLARVETEAGTGVQTTARSFALTWEGEGGTQWTLERADGKVLGCYDDGDRILCDSDVPNGEVWGFRALD